MNMVSVMNEVQRVCGENVRIYTGDAHTVSRVCAGMVFLKEFIFVDGVNVRKLIDDLGYLILLNISRISIPTHEICNAVELSNYPFVYPRLKFDEKNGCDCENYIGIT